MEDDQLPQLATNDEKFARLEGEKLKVVPHPTPTR
jgi:hypothetical protein